MTDDDALARFARRVVAVQEERKSAVDEELLRAIAAELGMDDAALAAARAEAESRKLRARTLRQAGQIDRAVDELENVCAFNPLDLDAQRLLADALHTRALRTRSVEDHARAKGLVLGVLEVAPADTEAAALLNAIDNADPAKGASNLIPVTVAIFAATLFMAVGWWLVSH